MRGNSKAERMADVAEQTRKDSGERVTSLRLQVFLWRDAFCIVSHHPEKARTIMHWMALHATVVGDELQLQAYADHWLDVAQRCGRASGVFDDRGPKCNGLLPSLIPPSLRKVRA